jgi:hypothetical protein
MLDNSTIHRYNNKFYNSENTALRNEVVVANGSGENKFLNGTHMTWSAVVNTSGSVELLVLAQTEGNDFICLLGILVLACGLA